MTREEQIQEALKQGYSEEEVNTYLDSIDSEITKPNLNTIDSEITKPNLNTINSEITKPSNDKVISPDYFSQEELNILEQGEVELPVETESEVVPPNYFTQEEVDILNQGPEKVPEEPELTKEDAAALIKSGEKPSKYIGVNPEDVPFIDRILQSGETGFDSLGDVKSGYDLALGSIDEQTEEMAAIKSESIVERLTAIPTLRARDIQRIAEEEGLIPAGFLIPSFILEQILKSGPQMAGPILVSLGVTSAMAATGVLAPAAIPVGIVAGIVTYGLQQFGNFMNTQGLEAEAPEDLDVGQAAKWATLTAPVGFVVDRFVFGLKLFPQKEVAKEITKELARRKVSGVVASQATGGAVKGFIVEAPTEVLETWAEFHQAGMDVSSEEAKEAYFESFWSGGATGGGISSASRAYQGYKNHKKAVVEAEEIRQKEANKKEQGDPIKTRRSVIEEEKKAQKEETKRFKANQAKKGNLNTLDKGVFKLLDVRETLAGAKKILGLDLSSVGNIDMAINFLERASEKKSTNSAAIKNYVAALKRKKNKLNKINKSSKKIQGKKVTDAGDINIQPINIDTLIQTKEGIDTVLNNMATYFPNITKQEMNKRRQELKKLKANRIKEDKKVKKVEPKTIPKSKAKPLKVTPKGKLNPTTENIINRTLSRFGIDTSTTNATNIDRNLQTRIINDVNETAKQRYQDYDQTEGKRTLKDFVLEIEDSVDILDLEAGVFSTETINTLKDLAPKQEVQNAKRTGEGIVGAAGAVNQEGIRVSNETPVQSKEESDAKVVNETDGDAVDTPGPNTGQPTGRKGGVDDSLDLPTRVKNAKKLLRNVDPDNQLFPDYKETLKSPDITQEELTQIENDLKEVTNTKLFSKRKGKEGDKAIIKALKNKKNIKQVLNTLLSKKNLLSPAQKELVQRIIALPNINTTKFSIVKNLEKEVGAYGTYDVQTNSIALSENAGIETILHEATHAATSNELSKHVNIKNEGITETGKQLVSLFNQSKEADVNNQFDDAFDNMDEFISESFNNTRFQRFLGKIITQDVKNGLDAAEDYIAGLNLYDKQPTNKEVNRIKKEFISQYTNQKPPSTGWANFISSVKNIIKGKKVHYSVLNDVISLAPELFVGPNIEQQSQSPQLKLFKKSKIKQQVEDNKSDKQKEIDKRRANNLPLEDPTENFPNKTKTSFFDNLINYVSSYDASLNRAIRRRMNKDKVKSEKMFDSLMRMDIGQSVHASTLAQAFLENGKISYKDNRLAFQVEEGEHSMKKLRTLISDFAKKHTDGDVKLAEEFIGQAFIALRAKYFKEQNRINYDKAQSLRNQGKDDAANKLLEQKVLVPETDAQLDELIKRYEEYPELNDIQTEWIGVKNSVLDVLLAEEIIDQTTYDELTQIVDVEGFTEAIERDLFVPFYRETQPRTPSESKAGTGNRTLIVPIKGSFEPVANVFDNMEKFVRAGISQAIINRTAREKVAGALEYLPDDITRVTKRSKNNPMNTVEIHQLDENGKAERAFYEFSNPWYAKSVQGVESAMTSASNIFASFSTFLRDAIVLNPIFGTAQTFIQDLHSAVFTSGLRYGALTILPRVIYEFPATILGISKTHKYLNKVGATGGSAFQQSETAMEKDIRSPSVYNTLRRAISKIPGLLDVNPIKVGEKRLSIGALLARIAMASDNSVRQAVYQQAKLEGYSEAQAQRMATELINFRRVGSGKYITIGRSYIPFFGAAIQALSVQGKAIQGMAVRGGGITPRERSVHTKNFLSAWLQTAGINLVYNMLMDDDDALEALTGLDASEGTKKEFKDADPKIRDRRYIIGDSGFQLTLRPDIFTYLAKILPEQIYQSMIAESQDAKKFWDSLKRNAVEIVQLNLIPQLLRPLINVKYNFDPRTGRPILPISMQGLPTEEQYTAGTSEAAKQIGAITGTSPIYVDYFFRQYTGYLGGFGTMIADEALYGSGVLGKERPDKSLRDTIASIPGMTNFMRTEKGNRFIADLFELKAEATKIVNTFNFYEKNGWDRGFEAADFLSKGNNQKLFDAKKDIDRMMKVIEQLRLKEKRILEAPSGFMDGADKKAELDLMHEQKLDALQNILELRQRVYGINPFDGWGDMLYKSNKPKED